jgi:hypothetical protein
MNVDIKDYIEKKKWKYKEVGDQFQLQVCPFCKDNKWHFYISQETGQFYCHKGDCQHKGHHITNTDIASDPDIFEIVALLDIPVGLLHTSNEPNNTPPSSKRSPSGAAPPHNCSATSLAPLQIP